MSAKNNGCGMLLPIHFILFAGIVLGVIAKFFVSMDGNAVSLWLSCIAAGIGVAYVLASVADCVKRGLALKADPLSDSIDVRDRAVAKDLAENLAGSGPLARQARRLLAAWGAGAVGPQVARMAASQMYRTIFTLAAEGIAVFIICLVANKSEGIPADILSVLAVLVPFVACARIQRATRESGYLESQLIARIGNDTPGAAAADFADKAASAMDTATAKLSDSQEKAAKAVEAATAKLAEAQEKALSALAAAQAKSADAIAAAQSKSADAIAKSHTDAAASLAQSQTEVARQLDRVTALASSIENVLKLQQSVDGTLKGVAAADEFKSTLLELKRHLAESDTLLKNVTKPRTIRFVENPAE